MTTVFETKIRHIGNSYGVIIPNNILKEIGAENGDTLKITIAIDEKQKMKAIKKITGICKGKRSFERDRGDRF